MLRRIWITVWLVALPAAAFAAAAKRDPVPASAATKAAPAVKVAPIIKQGEIGGARFTVILPPKWNRRLLLIAHGYRPETAPMVADLGLEQTAYKTLVDEGWMVAKTSFRRNGMIVADAIKDLDALRGFLSQTYGAPVRVILEGESMGGLIVTLIAEREPTLYQGAVAVGAALDAKEDNMTVGLSLQPKLPIIFLTNQSELDGPKGYITAKVPANDLTVHPALFRVSRNGHVNVNQKERLVALRALNSWIDSGSGALPLPASGQPFYDVTADPVPVPSQVIPQADGRGFEARATEVSAINGNVQLNVQAADFAAAGIGPMTWFQLKLGDKVYRTRYARDFSDVKRGEWVAFINADGFTALARNFGDAASTAGIKLGDPATLRRYDDPTTPPP
jgi:pimeloyl-ACP methyl ester carboxylesterase